MFTKELQNAIQNLSKLPSIGEKTSLRLLLYLLSQPKEVSENIGKALINFRNNVQYCKLCNNISDSLICSICSNKNREKEIICVVENIIDVLAIEKTGSYRGLYHVIGGLISPIDGINPENLFLDTLIERIKKEEIKEVIFALNTSLEGETTSFYIYKMLENLKIKVSILSRGVSSGAELQYVDDISLGNSFQFRQPFETTFAFL